MPRNLTPTEALAALRKMAGDQPTGVESALLDVVEAARVLRDSIQWHERPGRTGWGVGALSLEVYDTAIDTLRAAVARETEADHE